MLALVFFFLFGHKAYANSSLINCVLQSLLPPGKSSLVKKEAPKDIDELIYSFQNGLVPNLNDPNQLMAFEVYRIMTFGEPSTTLLEDTAKQIAKVQKRHPELSKTSFHTMEITSNQTVYDSTPELDNLIKTSNKSDGQTRGKLLQLDANKGTWLKLDYSVKDANGKKTSVKLFTEAEFDELFPLEFKQKLQDPNVEAEQKYQALFAKLQAFSASKSKQGHNVTALSQLLADIAHSYSLQLDSVKSGFASKDGMDKLQALKQAHDLRDEFAKQYYGKDYANMLKELKIHAPSGAPAPLKVVEQLKGIESEVTASAKTTSGDQNRVLVRPLSLAEAPYRSCLGKDCSSRTYLTKAMDPDYIYFTRTDSYGHSDGHVTIVLGTAKHGRTNKKVAFIDKIQNIPNVDLAITLDAIRQSLLLKGYELSIPKDLGGHNGISNFEWTRDFIKNNLVSYTGQATEYHAFKPHKNHPYHFSNEYSRANDKLTVRPLKILESNDKVSINPLNQHEPWSVDSIDIEAIFERITKLQNGSDLDKAKLVRIYPKMGVVQQKLEINFEALLAQWMQSPQSSYQLKKTILNHYSRNTPEKFKELFPYLSDQHKINFIQDWAQSSFISETHFNNYIPTEAAISTAIKMKTIPDKLKLLILQKNTNIQKLKPDDDAYKLLIRLARDPDPKINSAFFVHQKIDLNQLKEGSEVYDIYLNLAKNPETLNTFLYYSKTSIENLNPQSPFFKTIFAYLKSNEISQELKQAVILKYNGIVSKLGENIPYFQDYIDLMSDPNPSIRSATLRGLKLNFKELNPKSQFYQSYLKLMKDPDLEVQSTVASWFNSCFKESVDLTSNNPIVNAYIDLMGSNLKEVRHDAARNFSSTLDIDKLDPNSKLHIAIAKLMDDQSPDVRSAFLMHHNFDPLKLPKNSPLYKAFLKRLNDSSHSIRRRAHWMLSESSRIVELGSDIYWYKLAGSMKNRAKHRYDKIKQHPFEHIVVLAALGLGSFAGKTMIQAAQDSAIEDDLDRTFRDKNWYENPKHRSYVVWALFKKGHEDTVLEQLAEVPWYKYPEFKKALLKSLKSNSDNSYFVDTILSLLSKYDWSQDTEVKQALTSLDNPKVDSILNAYKYEKNRILEAKENELIQEAEEVTSQLLNLKNRRWMNSSKDTEFILTNLNSKNDYIVSRTIWFLTYDNKDKWLRHQKIKNAVFNFLSDPSTSSKVDLKGLLSNEWYKDPETSKFVISLLKANKDFIPDHRIPYIKLPELKSAPELRNIILDILHGPKNKRQQAMEYRILVSDWQKDDDIKAYMLNLLHNPNTDDDLKLFILINFDWIKDSRSKNLVLKKFSQPNNNKFISLICEAEWTKSKEFSPLMLNYLNNFNSSDLHIFTGCMKNYPWHKDPVLKAKTLSILSRFDDESLGESQIDLITSDPYWYRDQELKQMFIGWLNSDSDSGLQLRALSKVKYRQLSDDEELKNQVITILEAHPYIFPDIFDDYDWIQDKSIYPIVLKHLKSYTKSNPDATLAWLLVLKNRPWYKNLPLRSTVISLLEQPELDHDIKKRLYSVLGEAMWWDDTRIKKVVFKSFLKNDLESIQPALSALNQIPWHKDKVLKQRIIELSAGNNPAVRLSVLKLLKESKQPWYEDNSLRQILGPIVSDFNDPSNQSLALEVLAKFPWYQDSKLKSYVVAQLDSSYWDTVMAAALRMQDFNWQADPVIKAKMQLIQDQFNEASTQSQ